MMESIEKLREFVDDQFVISGQAYLQGMAIAGSIEREIAERYMLLPCDADGVPWHIGDAIKGHGELRCMSLDKYGWAFVDSTAIDPRLHRHHNPRTVEDVLHDYGEEIARQGHQAGLTMGEITAKYADELRGMMKEGGDD